MKTLTHDVEAGEAIYDVCNKAVDMAKKNDAVVKFTFNGIEMMCYPYHRAAIMEAIYHERHRVRHGSQSLRCPSCGTKLKLIRE